jgi:hypothetical protein
MASGMDRDFPMTHRQTVILVAGLAVMIAIGVALFGGLLPGIHPNFSSSFVTIEGDQYYFEETPLQIPIFVNYSAPWNVTFHNVTFELWLTSWYSALGGEVNGIGTELNGSHHSFVLGGPSPNGTRASLFLSPDREWGVGWPGGVLGGLEAQLYVKA